MKGQGQEMKELLKKLRWKWHRDITELSTGTVLEKLEKIAAQIESPPERINNFIRKTELAKVYSFMEDRESQKLFWARAHYTWDGNLGPLFQFLIESEREGNPVDCISLLRDKKNGSARPLIMFGGSSYAKETFDGCANIGIQFDYICVEDDMSMFTNTNPLVWMGTSYRGVPIISESDLLTNHQDADVII